jgi:hypothetical protein
MRKSQRAGTTECMARYQCNGWKGEVENRMDQLDKSIRDPGGSAAFDLQDRIRLCLQMGSCRIHLAPIP